MIVMQGDVVHRLIAFLKHLPVPIGVMIEEGRGGDAGDGLDARIGPFHRLGGLEGEYAVALRVALPGAYLPRAVHFVAETPGLDVVGLFTAVFAPQIGPPGAALKVGIFHAVYGVLKSAGA